GPGGTNNLTLNNYVLVLPAAPVANFTADPTNGVAPLTVSFTNLSSGATNYDWSFGDGQTSTALNPVNIYTNTGSYSVTLIATGPGGTNSVTFSNYVTAILLPPAANFIADPTNGVAPLTVSFTNLSSRATNYSWSFGDGNSSTDANPVTTYTNGGTYSVTLAVIGEGG